MDIFSINLSLYNDPPPPNPIILVCLGLLLFALIHFILHQIKKFRASRQITTVAIAFLLFTHYADARTKPFRNIAKTSGKVAKYSLPLALPYPIYLGMEYLFNAWQNPTAPDSLLVFSFLGTLAVLILLIVRVAIRLATRFFCKKAPPPDLNLEMDTLKSQIHELLNRSNPPNNPSPQINSHSHH
jgi:hypothetical protein